MTHHTPVRARVPWRVTLRRTRDLTDRQPVRTPEDAALAASLITGISQVPVPVDPEQGAWKVELTEAQENRLLVDGFLLLDHLYFDLTASAP